MHVSSRTTFSRPSNQAQGKVGIVQITFQARCSCLTYATCGEFRCVTSQGSFKPANPLLWLRLFLYQALGESWRLSPLLTGGRVFSQ
jgi:hypothetical protein